MACCCSGGKSSIFGALVAAAGILAFAGWQVAESKQDASDSKVREAIITAAMDYPMSWYEGDAERMKRRLHPDLRKCISVPPVSADSEWTLREMTAQELIDLVGTGRGKETPAEVRKHDVTVLDVFGDIASVRIDMDAWSDFVHLAKIDGEWKIINVLWDLTPEAKLRRE